MTHIKHVNKVKQIVKRCMNCGMEYQFHNKDLADRARYCNQPLCMKHADTHGNHVRRLVQSN